MGRGKFGYREIYIKDHIVNHGQKKWDTSHGKKKELGKKEF